MKNKKYLIIGVVILVIAAIVSIMVLNKKEGPKEEQPVEIVHTMYVKINPLVKLTFKETFKKCEDETGEYSCSEISSIIDYELVNNDAKDIYNDLDFKGKEVYDVLTMLCDTARENDIAFEDLEITSDYDFDLTETEILNKINEKSNYEYTFSIFVSFEEFINDKEVIDDYENSIQKYTVTFDTDGRNEIFGLKVTENELVTKPEDPTKEGYRFIEWQLDGKTFDFDTKVTQDITLKAKWEKVITYTVTFDTDGGSNINSIAVEKNDTINKPSNPTKEGYDFVEWQLNGKKFNFNTKITKDITLKAVWKKFDPTIKKYTVTFNTDGGSSIESEIVEENNVLEKPSNPTKEGYNFVEWQLNGEKFDFKTKIASDITLKAVWKEIIKYTVTFDTDGGNNVNSITVEENNTINKPSNPAKEGYDFVEWQLDGKAFDFKTKITKDITLKAVWKKAITSTMEKINLNENILIYKSAFSTKGCGSDVVFTDNIGEVMADYKSYDGYDIHSNSKFEIDYDDYATDEEFYEAYSKMNEARDKDFSEKKSKLIYNNSNVTKAHNDIENHLKTIKGLKSYSVNNNPESFVIEYEYIYISNSSSLGNFGKTFNQYYSNIDTKIDSIINQYGGKTLLYGGCGDWNDDPSILLTEEICEEYNLNCGRW